MTSDTTRNNRHLQLGIEAAQSGQKEAAKIHLISMLKQNPNCIPALFWLAFVADSPQQSIQLLERALTLDPENENAKAGLRWAKQQLASDVASPPPVSARNQTQTQAVPPRRNGRTGEIPDAFTPPQVTSGKPRRKHPKKQARPIRRKVDPVLAVGLALSVVAMLTLSVWLLALTPAETLAAWLPTPIVEDGASGGESVIFVAAEVSSTAVQTGETDPARSLASDNDTMTLQLPEPIETENVEHITEIQETEIETESLMSVAEPALESVSPTIESEALSTVPNEAENLSDIQPGDLIGPADDLLDGPRLFEPVDESLLYRQPASPDEKWIEVNVTEQRVTAWEGNVPVMSFVVSTGLPNTPTVLGEYNIYWKLESTLMAGPDYYLPNVPYTMYFYSGYALHGAYWHDNFGNPMSHGCVNLSEENAKEIFEWAAPVIPPGQTQVTATQDNPGTLVVVHQ